MIPAKYKPCKKIQYYLNFIPKHCTANYSVRYNGELRTIASIRSIIWGNVFAMDYFPSILANRFAEEAWIGVLL